MAEIPPSDPHQPPPSDGTPTPANFGQTGFSPYPRGVGGVDKAGLKSVALAQRRVLSAILANIGVTGLAYATQGAGSISPAMSIAVIALYICVVVFQVVAMVGLSNAWVEALGRPSSSALAASSRASRLSCCSCSTARQRRPFRPPESKLVSWARTFRNSTERGHRGWRWREGFLPRSGSCVASLGFLPTVRRVAERNRPPRSTDARRRPNRQAARRAA